HGKAVRSLGFSPCSRVLLTGSADGTARLWQTPSVPGAQAGPDRRQAEAQKPFEPFELPSGMEVHAVAYSPKGTHVLIGLGAGMKGAAQLWALEKGRWVHKATLPHQVEVFAVAFSPDGKLMATGGRDRAARLWRRDGEQQGPALWHPAEVRGLAFSPNGRSL